STKVTSSASNCSRPIRTRSRASRDEEGLPIGNPPGIASGGKLGQVVFRTRGEGDDARQVVFPEIAGAMPCFRLFVRAADTDVVEGAAFVLALPDGDRYAAFVPLHHGACAVE